MTMQKNNWVKPAVAIGLACAALGASATDVSVTITGSKGISAAYNTSGSSSSYGWYNMGARELTVGNSSFWAYCIDPLTSATTSANWYSTASLDSFTDGSSSSGYAQEMKRTAYADKGRTYDAATQAAVQSNLKELFSYAYSDSLTSNEKSTAFGWAVWEIVMQDWTDAGKSQFDRLTGTMRNFGANTSSGSDPVDLQVNAYLSALSSNSWASIGLGTQTNWTYTVYYDSTSPYKQGFMTVTAPQPSSGTGNNVPEPGSLALAAAALFGLGWSRRRIGNRH